MPSSANPTISLQSGNVRYTKEPPWARTSHDALSGVDITIRSGQIIGLVGESGLALFDGQELYGVGQRSTGAIGAVLQHPEWSLDPMMSIGSSLEEPLRQVKGIGKAERHDRVAEILGKVGLPGEMMSRYPKELSGGQRQRASIARALITQPRFILFDEATQDKPVEIHICTIEWSRCS